MLPPPLAHIKSLGYAVFDNPKYDYDLNLEEAVKGLETQEDKDTVFQYALCPRNPIFSGDWIETYPSKEAHKRAMKNRTTQPS